ncbi:hypothetical protein BGZ61DRAFT_475220 [Ilyonectria robusta]|uniref:uncharacterized protein n=1 Tax=Ilyonectria robusta TaxID=1079257 RepID=UPI001E8E0FF0|nr:uncharacterized protein BGZ61DRAFT_475220 [Ilyonectria robusta]KAH8729635.1 hypothetical protein BGZ61DRAFT_475220 [Ilyonectria robusta]
MQHHPQHQQQGPPPSQHLQHSRPPSIVHQQHQAQAHPPPQQHQSAYSSQHSLPQAYQTGGQATSNQDSLNYYNHPSPYSTPGATSGYTSADTSDMMAAAQMPRPPYPPMSYHTPQSNSPASVASPSQHDQHRSIYGQPPQQHMQQSMYYPQSQYQPMPPQATASPYAQHAPHPQQSMTSQPNMMMSQTAPQNQMSQHAAQHAAQQHAHAGMTGSPRPKIEPQVPLQLQKPQSSPMPQAHHPQNGAQLQSPGNAAPGVNPNAAPGPIPATTPLVVRQDGNGVQWIAFEYSRDRVKMEYTIRCDVESVNTDELSPEFKQENCVYPRACCPKEQYRGNRLMYETDCNRVGWALAQLNIPLRGKRGLIQRAVDSWRNSNQDPRLRSRRVRRMAKMNNRKQVQASPHPGAAHMPGPSGPSGMPGAGPMGPGPTMGKPGLGSMGQPMHHHHPGGHPDGTGQGGDEVARVDIAYCTAIYTACRSGTRGHQELFFIGTVLYITIKSHTVAAAVSCLLCYWVCATPRRVQFALWLIKLHYCWPRGDGDSYEHHHHQPPTAQTPTVASDDVRPTHVFTGYNNQSYAGGQMSHMATHATSAVSTKRHSRSTGDEPDDLFPDIPEAKKRKFILVEDNVRGSRLRVRVTLEGVDTNEIPDSFRKGASVYPRSYFPREMQSPPPSATGSRFFGEDQDDDGIEETEGRDAGRRGGNRNGKQMVKVPMGEAQGEIAIPRMMKTTRGKEVRLNDLGYRMAWLQSRVFAGRTVFLQRALDCYRNKTRAAIESIMQDVKTVAPHFETRVGKRRWNARIHRGEKKDDE